MLNKTIIGAVALALQPMAAAQTNELDNIERITTTTSRFETVALSYPRALNWVSAETLATVEPQHIQQVLNRIAGVNLQRGNGQEYLPAIRSPVFTGAGACAELLTAEDGIALRAAGFCNINELFEAGTEYAQSIEVLKGPGTVIYGSNAMHGVVNVITRNPIDAPAFIGLELGSYGFKRLTTSAGNNADDHGLGINLAITDDTGYRDEEGFEQAKVHVRYRTRLDNVDVSAGLSLSTLDQETATFITGLDSYRDAEIAQSNVNPEAYRKADSARLWIRFSGAQQSVDGSYEWQVTPYVRHQDMDFLMHFLPGQPNELNDQTSFGVLSSAQWQLAPDVSLTVGADAEMTDASLQQIQANPTQGSAFLQATIPAGRQYDYAVDATMLAAFGELNWDLTDAWQLSAGARVERIEYDYDNLMNSGRVDEDGNTCGFGGCRYSRPDDRTDSFSEFSPQVSMSYQLDPQQMLFVVLAQGYRAPQATELYRLQRAQTVAELDSVKAQNLELGYKRVSAALEVQVAVYHMDKDNVIFRDSDFFNRSDAETRHQGVELTLGYQVNKQWRLSTAMTYSRHQYRNDLGDLLLAGKDMDTAPRRLATAQLQWTPTDSLTGEIDWRYTSEYFLEPENERLYNGHNIVDLRMRWQLNDDWQLNGQVLNALDRAYAERADYTVFSGPRYLPGRPRSVQMGVQYQF